MALHAGKAQELAAELAAEIANVAGDSPEFVTATRVGEADARVAMELFLAQSTADAAGWFASIGVVGLLIAGLLALFWLWMLVDSLTNASLDSTQKIVWAAVIFFFPFLGAVVYFFVARKPKAGTI